MTPVAIVGAGPVAMTTALLLANHGVASVMLEQAPERDPVGSKALCQQRDVLDIWARVGVGDELVARGITWDVGRTYYRDVELFQITFPDLGKAHYPGFVNIGQDVTERLLEEQVDASPHCEIRYGCEVVDIAQDDAGAEVRLADGTVVAAPYVVAADGARSPTRKRLGIGFPGRSFDDKFLICDIRAEMPFVNERRFFFDPEWNPGRQVLIHPQVDSVWRIDWQVPPDFDLEAEEASGGLDTRIRMIVGDVDYEVVWRSVYRFHERIADRFAAGRVFLAGDAAHLVAPFGARGLNSGVQDADNLAWKLAYVLNGWAPTSLLDTYAIERRAAAEENLRVTSATMRFLVPESGEERAHRDAVLQRALSDPDATAEVDSGKLAEPYCYADSPLTTPGTGDSGSAADGALVAGALCPDVPCTPPGRPGVQRLRQLFGRNPVVITSGAAAALLAVAPVEAPPVEVLPIGDVDPDGTLRAAVGRDAFALVVRPDGHLAAITDPTPAPVLAAVERALGRAA